MQRLALGLMSGTSLDGIDAALIVTDGVTVSKHGAWTTVPYDTALRERLRSVLGGVGDVAGAERALTEAHAAAVAKLLAEAGVAAREVAVIGFHGQTILHQPERRRTWQIGDGKLLSERTGIAVVNDFRSADVAAGGQGAPFAPLYHVALAQGLERPLAVLNLGGVGNVTWIGEGGPIAFDTGPANAPIDDWLRRHLGQPMDHGGQLARTGKVDGARVNAALAHRYFSLSPPKSLDRNDFTEAMVAGMSAADGAATLTEITAAAAAAALAHMPAPPRRWLVTGGGRHNAVLMAALARRIGVPVEPVEAAGWRGDALEAEAFAFLAVRSLEGLPLSLPGTTGVPQPMTGGRLWRP
ncbi:MAG TPA: anhydro-N-acetylmuramic acid kinase [Candidatus Cybelea sp.]|nr:anhydro-N-acetylmuramic acid kinase [Candidatus Cybelea sp.]